MLSFSKIFRELKDLKLLFFNIYRFKNSNYSIHNLYCSAYSSSLIQSNVYSTVSNENKLIPLLEINNLNFDHLHVDVGKLGQLFEEILQAKACGQKLPEYIKMSDIIDILECNTRSQRYKYLKYLFKTEKKKLNDAEKKLKKKMEYENKRDKSVLDTDHIEYGLGKNTLILRALKHSLCKYYDKRLANSVLFGQKMVIDLGYDKFMTKKERRGCVSQVRLVYSLNKMNREPYDLYFCNADSESRCVQYLRQDMPNIDNSFITVTDQSYLDLFPKEDLVYLSPHASETLTTYDHKAIYIIGGFVDTVKRAHVSLFKAQEEGIKSYALPLDEYVLWGCGSRSLSINQVFSIMQTIRDTGDWREAFKHIPTRKLRRVDANSLETQICPDKLYVMRSN